MQIIVHGYSKIINFLSSFVSCLEITKICKHWTTDTPRVFHVETTWKWSFPRFHVVSTWIARGMFVGIFYKVAGLRRLTLLKKRLQHSCFPVNIEQFLRTPIFEECL